MAFPEEQTTETIPYNLEAERAAVGTVLIDEGRFPEIKVHVRSAEEFHIHRHREIWRAYEQLRKQGTQIDLLTVSDQLRKQGSLEEVGGQSYLTSLIAEIFSTSSAESYAKIIHEYHVRRKMLQAANQIANLAYKGDGTIDEILSSASSQFSEALSAGMRARSRSLSEGILAVDEKIEHRREHGIMPGIKTNLIDLDKLLGGGAQNSDLILVAGRPGKGKTSALLQFLREAGDQGKRVVFFSLEMPEEQIILRLLSQISGIDYQQLRSGLYPENKSEAYIQALETLSLMDIVIDDTPNVTPTYIKSRCQVLNAEKKIDAVFVDSLNLILYEGRQTERTDTAMDRNASELKTIARLLDVPVWCAHQMNRKIEGRSEGAKPVLSDLAEGGERPADIVMFIYHKMDATDEKKIETSSFIVEKHRNGPTGEAPVIFNQALTTFENAYVQRINFNK